MKWLAFLVVLAIAAFALKPDVPALEDKITEDLTRAAADLSVNREDDVLSGTLKVLCSVNADGCARVIRSGMEIQSADFYVALEARVDLAGSPALRCFGAFTQWTCWSEQ